MYSYYSVRLDSPDAVKRCLRMLLRTRKYHGLFSFSPETVTCVESADIPVLEKYEPFGLVAFKSGRDLILNRFVIKDMYDLYRPLVDPIRDDLRYAGPYYSVPVRMVRERFGI